MDEKIKKLFTPFNIGKEKIKNRFVVAPMGVPAYVDSNGAFTERGMQYFVERAKGGFGLIYTGVMLVDNEVEPMSPPSFLNHPEIFYPAATRLNERHSSYGAKFFCEVRSWRRTQLSYVQIAVARRSVWISSDDF